MNGKNGHHSPSVKPVKDQPLPSPALVDIRTSEATTSRTASPAPGTPPAAPHIHIGAIDNSLAFPWKHPDEWRSFPLYSPHPFPRLIRQWLAIPSCLTDRPTFFPAHPRPFHPPPNIQTMVARNIKAPPYIIRQRRRLSRTHVRTPTRRPQRPSLEHPRNTQTTRPRTPRTLSSSTRPCQRRRNGRPRCRSHDRPDVPTPAIP